MHQCQAEYRVAAAAAAAAALTFAAVLLVVKEHGPELHENMDLQRQ
jgi:hypothetical protein